MTDATGAPLRPIGVLDLGLMPYAKAHALQLALVAWRQEERIPDVLVLVEHQPVITLGRNANEGHILATPEALTREGISVVPVERGGDVTYHGPGQLVGYPIFRLADYGLGPSDYMHRLEDVIRGVLAAYGISTHRRDKSIGVWVGNNKIAALGVRIRRGVSFHGFALNVSSEMVHWSHIIPCGITDGGVTSMAAELPSVLSMAEVRRRVAAQVGRAFGRGIQPTTLEALHALAASGSLGTSSSTDSLPS